MANFISVEINIAEKTKQRRNNYDVIWKCSKESRKRTKL